MVKFNDYQCPPCRQTYEAYGPLLEKWTKTGQFKFVLKHFPLDSICNGGSGLGPSGRLRRRCCRRPRAPKERWIGGEARALALQSPGAAASDTC